MQKLSVYDLSAPEEKENAKQRLESILKNNYIPKYNRVFMKKNGEKFFAEITLSTVRNSDDTLRYIQSIVKDLTAEKKAEQEIKEGHERISAFVNQNLIGVSLVSADGKIFSTNQHLLDIFEFTGDSIEGVYIRDYKELFMLNDFEMLVKYFRDFRDKGLLESFQTEMEIKTFKGNSKWISLNFTPTVYREERALASVMIDVTERKKAQINLENERKVLRSFAEYSGDEPDIKDLSYSILKSIIETLDFDSGTLRLILDNESDVLEPIAIYGIPDELLPLIEPKTIEDDTFLSHFYALSKIPMYVSDVSKNKVFKKLKKRLKLFNVKAIIGWPILTSENKVIGTITVNSKDAKEITEDQKDFFKSISGILSKLSERIIFMNALSVSEEKYRVFAEQSIAGVCIFDTNGQVNFCNNEFSKIFDQPINNCLDNNITDLISFKDIRDQKKFNTYVQNITKDDKESQLLSNACITTKENKERCITFHLTPIQFKNKIMVGGIIIDISEQKMAQDKLNRERHIYQLIANASVKATNLKELNQTILEGLINLFGFDSGTIRIYNEKERILIPIADYGLSSLGKELLKQQKIDNKDFFFKDNVGKKIFATDITKHPVVKGIQHLKKDKYKSYISWPVFNAKKEFLGSIQLGSRTQQVLLQDDEEVFETISDMLATAIERLLASEESVRNQLQFKHTVDNVLDGILILEKGKIVYGNDRLYEIFGYTLEEFQKMEHFDFISPDYMNEFMEKHDSLSKRSMTEPLDIEYWIKRKDGSKKYIKSKTTSSIDEDGNVRTFVVASDITDMKLAEDKLQKFTEELEETIASRTNELQEAISELEAFSYSVSHDLRAPLRAINGFSKILQDEYSEELDETGLGYLSRVRSATLNMESLINNLLDLSRITRSKLNFKEIDLSEFANAIIKEKKELLEDRDIDFKITDNLKTIGDPRLIRVVVENLLSNAIKFTKNTEEAEITFGSKEDEGKTIFFLKDDGVGFDM
ncbi:MAG: PAS domain S-box protein, partial [Candidatus Heimdallarchaeota archaeon]